LTEEYDEFLYDIAPTHWRTTGHHYSELRRMKEDVEEFTAISPDEEQIDWVKKQRARKIDWVKNKNK